jgi:uncharacterized protein YkwD
MKRICLTVFLLISICVNPIFGQRDTEVEALVHKKINALRTKHGVRALRRDMLLDSAAALQVAWCRDNQVLTHTRGQGPLLQPKDRLEAVGYDWTTYGENLLYRSTNEESADELADLIVQQWIASHSHYQNLLTADYRYAGTAVMRDAEGKVFAGQVFATPDRVFRPQSSASRHR